LHLSYMHEPLVPGMQWLMRLLAPFSQGHAQIAYASGYIPLRQTLRLTMQSHPVAWSQSNDNVVPSAALFTSSIPSMEPPCKGIWCLSRNPFQPGTPSGSDDLPAYPDESLLRPVHPPVPPRHPPPQVSETAGSGPNENTVPVDPEDACGTVLCCV